MLVVGRSKNSVLIVSYHFPPVQGSSGVHRILALARYLGEFDWQSTILTIDPKAYPRSDDANVSLVPGHTKVIRCFGLDTKRHLAIRGRYPSVLAVPDRWQSWIPSGVATGLRLVRESAPNVIVSSFPIASAHVIARTLHRRTGIPWIADMRDPMVLDNHPPPGIVRRTYEALEDSAFREAARVIVTTPGAASLYKTKYPEYASEKIRVIENGVDSEMFDRIRSDTTPATHGSGVCILHSGLIYPEARDPRPLFSALASLLTSREIGEGEVTVTFRASGQEYFILEAAGRFGLNGMVRVEPAIAYESAIREMLTTDSLLLIQSAACNSQIPAKAYEYLYSGKPILALTSPEGDTGRLLRRFPNCDVVALEDTARIEPTLRRHIGRLRTGNSGKREDAELAKLSRRGRTGAFAEVLDDVAGLKRRSAGTAVFHG